MRGEMLAYKTMVINSSCWSSPSFQHKVHQWLTTRFTATFSHAISLRRYSSLHMSISLCLHGIPRSLLQALGMFWISIVYMYLAEEASRMMALGDQTGVDDGIFWISLVNKIQAPILSLNVVLQHAGWSDHGHANGSKDCDTRGWYGFVVC